jgi:DNA-binding NarL/FixJ family response regulator
MLTDKKKITIAIVDDHPIVLEGLQKVLMQAYDYVSTICFSTGGEFLNFIKKAGTGTDIVLIDITLPDINGIDLCREVKMLSAGTCVLAFSNHNERSTIMRMLQNGASGYLLKNSSADEVVSCINEALGGQIALSREAREIMARPSARDWQVLPALTKREKEVLKLVADGQTSATIAAQLHVSPLTIETHRRNLMQKFNVKSMAAAVKVAMDMGLLS